jgi:IS30 family transposase
MTNKEKTKLRKLAKEGLSVAEIRRFVNCSDATIRNYIKVFNLPKPMRTNAKT